jgi:hypothetical protein
MPPRGRTVLLPRSTASASIDVTPGTLHSADATSAAPHDEQVVAPAGAGVEHQGQRVGSGEGAARSSAMTDTLASRRKPAHHSMVRGSGSPTCHSHSIVAGGLLLMSYTTRLTLGTSLTMRDEILARTSYGSFAQSAVIPSSDVTARMATTLA